MRAYFIACLFLFHFALTRADDGEYASVLLDPLSNRLYVEDDVLEGAVAWAKFSNQVNKTGYVGFVLYTLSELSCLILFIF
jgi:hypothetical protein